MDLRDVYNVSLCVYSGLCDPESAKVGMSVEDYLALNDETAEIWERMTLENQQELEKFVEQHCENYQVLMNDSRESIKHIESLLWEQLDFVTSRQFNTRCLALIQWRHNGLALWWIRKTSFEVGSFFFK